MSEKSGIVTCEGCGSQEIYRFVEGMKAWDACPFSSGCCAFVLDGADDNKGNLRCPEFCPKGKVEVATC